MPEATRKQKVLILTGAGLVLAGGAWGLSRAPRTDDPGAQAVLAHYFAVTDDGRYDEAWRQDTTASYRAHAPLEGFRLTLQMHRLRWGRIVERRRIPLMHKGFYSISRGPGVMDCYFLRFEAGLEPGRPICYTVVRDASGRWAIDWPQVYMVARNEPVPWAF